VADSGGWHHRRGRCSEDERNSIIKTLLEEWAWARIYGSSAERRAALPLFLDHYNFRRPHGSLGKQAPATRVTNLVGNYT
jgi:transposase InsO family protein